MSTQINEGLMKWLLRRANIATLTSAALVIGGAVYFFVTGDGDSAKWLVGIGAGWLFATAAMGKKEATTSA